MVKFRFISFAPQVKLGNDNPEVAPLLRRLAETNQTFSSLNG